MLLPLLGDELVGHGDEDVLVADGPEAAAGHVLVVELLAQTLLGLLHPEVPFLEIDGLNERTVWLFVLHLDCLGELGLLRFLLLLEPTIEHLGDVGVHIVWLLVLMLSSTVSGLILRHYETTFAAIPLLVSFIPTLMDTGGNSGSQASTMVIRGLATGEIELRDALKVIWKEMRVGMLCGVVLAVLNFIRLVLTYPGNTLICLTVVLSMLITVILAKTLGAILPLLAKSLHMDPALMASPMLTTIVDACSMIIYFTLATHMLGLVK